MAGFLLALAFLLSNCEAAGNGWLVQPVLVFLLCFAFVTVSLFGDLLLLYDALVQLLLHSGKDGNALA
jgi:hypothetical protein